MHELRRSDHPERPRVGADRGQGTTLLPGRPSNSRSWFGTQRTCINTARPKRSSAALSAVLAPRGDRARDEGTGEDARRPRREGLSRKAILEQVEASLTRLGTDYIDLYQIHRFDPETPVEETMEALHEIIKAGKVRYIGASSMYGWQFAKLQHAADSAAGHGSCRCRISTTCCAGTTSQS